MRLLFLSVCGLALAFGLSFSGHFFVASADQALGAAKNPAAHYGTNPRQEIFRADSLTWHPEKSLPPGAQTVVIEGDPTKRGLVILRLKMPNGYRVPPVWHPAADRFTVILGTYHLGVGTKFDKEKTVSLSAGDHAWLSPAAPHFGWCTGETVLEIIGLGPFVTNYVNPDEHSRKNNFLGSDARIASVVSPYILRRFRAAEEALDWCFPLRLMFG